MHAFAIATAGGLGMTSREFWAATPREFAARRKVFTDDREYTLQMYAGLQASLANGPLVRTDKQMWTPSMFLPGYQTGDGITGEVRQDESWRAAKRQLMSMQHQRTPAERAALAAASREFSERQSRAAAAQASGASGAEVIAIMEGL